MGMPLNWKQCLRSLFPAWREPFAGQLKIASHAIPLVGYRRVMLVVGSTERIDRIPVQRCQIYACVGLLGQADLSMGQN